jgi:hypothetical protein
MSRLITNLRNLLVSRATEIKEIKRLASIQQVLQRLDSTSKPMLAASMGLLVE